MQVVMYQRRIDRLDEYIKYIGMSDRAFEISINAPNGTIRKSREERRDVSDKYVEKILLNHPALSRVWLLTGEGEMLVTSPPKGEDVTVGEPSADDEGGYMVPLLPTVAYGGELSGWGDDGIMPYDCERIASPIRGVDFGIRITGKSMEPIYPEGCMVFVKRVNEKAFIEWGKTFLLDTVNGSIIKRLKPSQDPTVVRCESYNPDYPPFEVSYEDIRGVYIVLAQFNLC